MAKLAKNGKTYPRMVVNGRNRVFTENSEQATMSRLALMSLGNLLPELDIDTECRYPPSLSLEDMKKMYDREGLATRIVNVYPEEAWSMGPDIYETEDLNDVTKFESDWMEMDRKLNVLSKLQTVDEISGIGQYGVVLLGFDDGQPLDKPVVGVKDDGTVDERFSKRNLIYLRPMHQKGASIKKLESNTRNPRYGQPLTYSLEMVKLSETATPSSLSNGGLGIDTQVPTTPVDVHWSRVLHVPCNPKDSDVFGVPRLQNTYNRVWDVRKILGANGQGFWYSGIPSLSVETQPNIEDPEIDIEAVKEELQNFMTRLQKYIALQGMSAKPLNFILNDPGPSLDAHIKIICITMAVPLRVFLGTEEAKLASSQDMRTWNKRLTKYQNFHINPYIINPFFERMFLVGALTRPKQLIVGWPDLNAPTENDRATTAAKVTEALVKYIQGNVFVIMKPREFLINVLGFSPKVVDSVLKSTGVQKMMSKLDKILNAATQPKPTVAGAGKKNLPKRTKNPSSSEGAGPSR